MAKYNIYAVAHGFDPTTKTAVSGLKFYSWNECKPFVTGVEGARFKGFLTEAEADTWLAKETEVQTEKEPIKKEYHGSFEMDEENAKKTAKTLNKAYENAPENKKDGYFYIPEFYQVCTEMGILPFAMLTLLQKQFIEQQKNIKKMHEAMGDLKNELPFK